MNALPPIYNSVQESPALQSRDELNSDMSSTLGKPHLLRWGGCHKKNEDGQALLLVLIVLSLVLTLVLSSVSKSVTDIEISKYEDNSIRAFDAAQAGIEKMVVGGATSGTTVSLSNDATYTPVVSSSTNTANFYNYPIDLVSGESATITFLDYKLSSGDYVPACDSGGSCKIPAQLRVCWGKSGTPVSDVQTPALYLEFYYNSDTANPQKWENFANLSDIKIATLSADPFVARRNTNKFSAPDISGGIGCPSDGGWQFSTRYDVGSGSNPILPSGLSDGSLLFLKITMLYNNSPQPLGVRSASPLTSQGSVISSTGRSDDVYRKLVLYQGYPEIPYEFTNAIYSKLSLIK